ncbi:bifunctional hydroxymethylpyrimidine kinase/phosphomethylpyrimidine kinase [Jiella sonneratiae]|uniref:hydroxymethylpyrimidine kinase n=1 Tax=Jiella sonneratiae TaxID=2816856 RepID=A0ABS3J2I4_9HYPH|nr:hydroxymethylpyrimidine/phosphomethylpyrimidine kinase [Jiella sonneratiae]MBO0903870.1 bifunctional hydroxymethylpyrimidine kinase/phosphomethylpyrimidine kinase [Jiella sonneratiae]
MTRPTILVVGGTDSSGGAGLAADIRTAAAHGVDARLAVTAVTAQTDHKVGTVAPMPPALVAEQIAFALEDGCVVAVKIGMLAEAAIVAAVAEALAGFAGPIVLDPVIAASSGGLLLSEEGTAGLIERLLPMTTLVTPNLPELSILASRAAGGSIAEYPAPASQTGSWGMGEARPQSHTVSGRSLRDAGNKDAHSPRGLDTSPALIEQISYHGMSRNAALVRSLFAAGAGAVLVKGGHGDGPDAADLFFRSGETAPRRYAAPRLDVALRGTGCMLATAIASNLAAGLALEDACGAAKDHVRALFEREAGRRRG